jgi:hypothetical protein
MMPADIPRDIAACTDDACPSRAVCRRYLSHEARKVDLPRVWFVPDRHPEEERCGEYLAVVDRG